MGLAFCGIYIRTGNLFLAIGFHALANNPGPLLTDGTIAEHLPTAIVLPSKRPVKLSITHISCMHRGWFSGIVRR
jgi:membrane protease YdiL (CAAX protease family)